MHEIFLFVMNMIIIIRFITLRSLILFYICILCKTYYFSSTLYTTYILYTTFSKLIQLKKAAFSSNNLIYSGEKVFDR